LSCWSTLTWNLLKVK